MIEFEHIAKKNNNKCHKSMYLIFYGNYQTFYINILNFLSIFK